MVSRPETQLVSSYPSHRCDANDFMDLGSPYTGCMPYYLTDEPCATHQMEPQASSSLSHGVRGRKRLSRIPRRQRCAENCTHCRAHQ